jgi:hypothetical protein
MHHDGVGTKMPASGCAESAHCFLFFCWRSFFFLGMDMLHNEGVHVVGGNESVSKAIPGCHVVTSSRLGSRLHCVSKSRGR